MVRGLQAHLTNYLLVKKHSIDSLQNKKVGIDANLWFHDLRQQDAALCTIGGTSSQFRCVLDEQLDRFKECGIVPVFVFSGVSPMCEQHSQERAIDLRQRRDNAWNQYETNRAVSKSLDSFDSVAPYVLSNHYANAIIKHLRQRNVEFIRAPCLVYAQLFSLIMHGYVDDVYGSNELLIYPFQRVITKIVPDRDEFYCIDRNTMLEQLGPWDTEQFLECCLLSGTFLLRTWSHIEQMSQFQSAFAVSHSLLSTNGYTPPLEIFKSREADSQYVNRFYMIKELFLYHTYIDINDCCVKYLNISRVPNINSMHVEAQMHHLIAPKLPDTIYFLLSQGVISPTLINHLVHFSIFEAVPLLDSKDFRDLTIKLNSLRQLTICLLATTSKVPNAFSRKIQYVPSGNTKLPPPFSIKPKSLPDSKYFWQLSDARDLLQKHRNRNGSYNTTFSSVLNAEIPFIDRFKPPINSLELAVYLRLQLLAYLNYFLPEPHKSVRTSVNLALAGCNSFDIPSLMFVESIRAKSLHWNPFTQITSSANSPPPPTQPLPEGLENQIRLITRTMSLIRLQVHHDKKFQGKVYRDLTEFYSITNTHAACLQQLRDSILTTLFEEHKIYLDIPTKDISCVMETDFVLKQNNGLGCVWMFLLTEISDSKDVVTQLQQAFPSAYQLSQQIALSIRWWNQCMKTIKTLVSKEKKNEEYSKQFTMADRLIRQKIKQYGLPTKRSYV